MIRPISKKQNERNHIVKLEKKELRKLDTGEVLFIFGFTSVIFLTILAIMCLTSCNVVERIDDKLGIPDDNILEESVEFIIEKETGMDIDLTPRSPEKKIE